MKLKLFQVDAFAENVFSGNPAAVVPLSKWLPDERMQNIAKENNLSETAFFIPSGNGFQIRWFTPVAEVNLCGHATLASAHVIFNHLDYSQPEISFQSKSGILKVTKEGEILELDFPSSPVKETDLPENVEKLFGIKPEKCFNGREDIMFTFANENEVLDLKPDFHLIKSIETRGIIATSLSNNYDFVSRFFAPAQGIDEDPVTGSAHTMLVPYWAKTLGKNELTAKQISSRGGLLHCKNHGKRVKIGGKAITYLTGEIHI